MRSHRTVEIIMSRDVSPGFFMRAKLDISEETFWISELEEMTRAGAAAGKSTKSAIMTLIR